MQPQYLADQSLCVGRFEALESQAAVSHAFGYLLTRLSAMLAPRWAFARRDLRWVPIRSSSLDGSIEKDRRRGCRRASSFLQWQAFWPVLQPVAAAPRKRHLSWLSPSRFRSSLHTPANSSNLVAGWAFGPAPLAPRAVPKSGGQPC